MNLPEPMIIPRMMEVPSNKPSSFRILTPSSFGLFSPGLLAADAGNNGWQVGGNGFSSAGIAMCLLNED